ncbi:lytic transglycosylase domain-containing protein [Paucidesulfovibrio longus]|uniref:lytic transglycosylase domain-containing protein n=1 Tax=Paucidesulfovibrio longus TaxID=889 RepID=UPI0003B6D1A9|nr:lytic transglycosylase domain-containing protein [Paucidesulfovibrio longus]
MRKAKRTFVFLCPALLAALVLGASLPAGAFERQAVSGADRTAEAVAEAAAFPSLLSCIRVEGPLDFCGEPVPLELDDVRERLEKEMLVLLWDRAQVILNAKRAGRYFPYIEQRLAKRGMPDDLKYIAVIESALRPHAGSHRGAVGYWQFIRPTAQKYGLRVDGNIDERRNIFTSTEAALDFLQELHDEFGSWAVACAAYNMGDNGMRKRIRIQGVQDYYRLYLPLETQAYVFRAMAAKMILSDPARYGFHFQEQDFYDAPDFDRITLTVAKDTPLADIAAAAGTYYKVIKDLNTQILGDDLVRGTHVLLLPKGSAKGFVARLKGVEAAPQSASAPARGVDPSKKELRTYVVRPGDNVHAIARRLGVPLNALLRPNGLKPDSVIHPGQRLLVAD